MTGAALPLVKSSLGGVKRVIWGVAMTLVVNMASATKALKEYFEVNESIILISFSENVNDAEALVPAMFELLDGQR